VVLYLLAALPFSLPYYEGRVSPVFSKFFYLDSMPIGLSSIALQYLLWKGEGRLNKVLSLCYGAQATLAYPLLGPVSILIPFSGVLFQKQFRFLHSISLVLLTTLLYFSVATISGDRLGTGIEVDLNLFAMLKRLFISIIILSPFLVFIGIKACKDKSLSSSKDVVFIAMLATVAFCVVRLPAEVQYKFLYGSMVILGFHAAAQFSQILSSLKSKRLILLLILVPLGWFLSF
jgi:hypothetical protein